MVAIGLPTGSLQTPPLIQFNLFKRLEDSTRDPGAFMDAPIEYIEYTRDADDLGPGAAGLRRRPVRRARPPGLRPPRAVRRRSRAHAGRRCVRSRDARRAAIEWSSRELPLDGHKVASQGLRPVNVRVGRARKVAVAAEPMRQVPDSLGCWWRRLRRWRRRLAHSAHVGGRVRACVRVGVRAVCTRCVHSHSARDHIFARKRHRT